MQRLLLRTCQLPSVPAQICNLTRLTHLVRCCCRWAAGRLERAAAGSAMSVACQGVRHTMRTCLRRAWPAPPLAAALEAPAPNPQLLRLPAQDLSRNQLVELPATLSALGSLKELVAEGNCFPRIPQASAGCGGRCFYLLPPLLAGTAVPASSPTCCCCAPPACVLAHRSTWRPHAQVLGLLPSLEVADLSFNIYMEAAASLAPLLENDGLEMLSRLDLRRVGSQGGGGGRGAAWPGCSVLPCAWVLRCEHVVGAEI